MSVRVIDLRLRSQARKAVMTGLTLGVFTKYDHKGRKKVSWFGPAITLVNSYKCTQILLWLILYSDLWDVCQWWQNVKVLGEMLYEASIVDIWYLSTPCQESSRAPQGYSQWEDSSINPQYSLVTPSPPAFIEWQFFLLLTVSTSCWPGVQ